MSRIVQFSGPSLKGGKIIFYSTMPDTTSNINPYRRPLRRLLGSAMVFLASLMLVASIGFAQDNGDRDCPDFNGDQQAAQDYFESRGPGDPDRLDGDDDGLACEEPGDDVAEDTDQESVFDPNDEEAVSSDQYQYEDGDQQQGVQTPQTGGPALLPLAGALILFMSGGCFLARR